MDKWLIFHIVLFMNHENEALVEHFKSVSCKFKTVDIFKHQATMYILSVFFTILHTGWL